MIVPGTIGLNAFVPSAAPGITPPSFIQVVSTVYNTTTDNKATSSFSVQSGDILVAIGAVEDHGSDITVTGGSLTWTLRQEVNVTNYSRVFLWTAVASSSTSFAVTFHRGSVRNFGGSVLTFRGGTVGASSKTNDSGAPSLALTTTQDNSAVVCAVADWNAVEGDTRVWRTINSITPTNGGSGEALYSFNSGIFTVYIGYWTNVGTAGSKTTGLSAPNTQKYSIVAQEILGA